MRARDHTLAQLSWFVAHGITLVDVAAHRQNTHTFIAQHQQRIDLKARYLAWLRYENTTHNADIYVRPARGYAWPLVFLDDVAPSHAMSLCQHCAALLIDTSPAGGCHVWLTTPKPLTEYERKAAQQALQPLFDADPASTSGDHWGRLAGMKNHKRGGCWVNVRVAQKGASVEVSYPTSYRCQCHKTGKGNASRDESVAEFAWCCHRLREGWTPERVEQELRLRASARQKRYPADYAARTVAAALRRLW